MKQVMREKEKHRNKQGVAVKVPEIRVNADSEIDSYDVDIGTSMSHRSNLRGDESPEAKLVDIKMRTYSFG